MGSKAFRRSTTVIVGARAVVVCALSALMLTACSKPPPEPQRMAGPMPQDPQVAQAAPAQAAHDESPPGDPIPGATPEPKRGTLPPDDSREPWSPNYGGPSPLRRPAEAAPLPVAPAAASGDESEDAVKPVRTSAGGWAPRIAR